jgi:threonine dehydrogenase-like Zn-dependent dehydrogenase
LEPNQAFKVGGGLLDVGVLVEPASVVAKAWEHIDCIGRSAFWRPERVLITGAGPIGLLAALMGFQRGLEVHVLDILEDGPKPQLVSDLGAVYHVGDLAAACSTADVVLECTGVGQLVYQVMQCTAANAIVCLTGISSGARRVEVDMAALNRSLVFENVVVFGTVNANRRHYAMAIEALYKADREWLERLITRRVPLERWSELLTRDVHDIKSVIQF